MVCPQLFPRGLTRFSQARVRHRHRALPELRRSLKDHRRHRGSTSDCENPVHSARHRAYRRSESICSNRPKRPEPIALVR
jgi:hypothetical protein